ncbi:GDSL esterase/lipase 5-like [Mangifera indica]|uniref:GDSL esterase/lipase 5-like n=1 Tax=Mangifera indica TaxID=29780 RepID=UPI001CFB48E4|nr:GDSL esterase/lipase 5-like [Mangifera indica]
MARLVFRLELFSGCVILLLLISVKASSGSSLEKTNALFVFGDSTVDAGNNNYINTMPENPANFKPYGQNGFFGGPTGRFSDGRVIVDFIASYANLPLIPPFLEPSADYINGVNFAAGGAGVLPETHQGLVIDLRTQLKNFEEVKKSLTEKLGEAEAEKLISGAVYFISIGSNDYMGGYLDNPKMQQDYQPEDYLSMVIGNLTEVIQLLYKKGGRKFGFMSVSPLGCMPSWRALNLNKESEGGCYEAASSLAEAHNNALKGILSSLAYIFKDFKYSNANFYNWLEDRMNNPGNYGFKDGVNACCGSGPYRGTFTCGGSKNTSSYDLCDNPDDHIWWDSFHLTEKIHEQFAKTLWDGPSSSVGPFNLRDLFFPTIADVVDAPQPHGYISQF